MSHAAMKLSEAIQVLNADAPTLSDPPLHEALEVIISVTQTAGVQLLSPRFDVPRAAVDEVLTYIGYLERTKAALRGAPFTYPTSALGKIKVAGRLAETTNDLDDVTAVLYGIPEIITASTRSLHRYYRDAIRPASGVLDILWRAGDLYLSCLHATIPVRDK